MDSVKGYSKIQQLGKGKYGNVYLVSKNGIKYAMKVVEGDHAVGRNQIEILKKLNASSVPSNFIIKLVDNVLDKRVHSNFIIKLLDNFHEGTNLYLVFEFAPRGTLSALIKSKRQFEEGRARFYAMQAILAIEYLHRNDVVHRDIKPENILIGKNGYLKLADFGFSKILAQDARTYSFCGTTDYLAPEIIMGNGHGKTVDWWAMGVLIYEMMSGRTPFKGDNDEDTKNRIHNQILKSPAHFSGNLKMIIQGLLTKDRCNRLGCGDKGVENIKSHVWFIDHSWFPGLSWLFGEYYFTWKGIENQSVLAIF